MRDFLQKTAPAATPSSKLGASKTRSSSRAPIRLGAGLTKQIAYSKEPGDLGDQYNSFLDAEGEVDPANISNGQVFISRDGKLLAPKRPALEPLPVPRWHGGRPAWCSTAVTSLQNGADLLWIETEKPHVEQIASMVDRIREVVPNAKLVYNNSPSFNWTLSFRQQIFDAWVEAGKECLLTNATA